jgi:cytochrome c5
MLSQKGDGTLTEYCHSGDTMQKFRQLITKVIDSSKTIVGRFKAWFHANWYIIIPAFLLLIIAAFAIGTAASNAYQHRDNGSNSIFSRLSGEGWQFQRGAAPPSADIYGDHVSSVRYLDQHWTPADSMRFYTISQGSDLMPYDFFLVLRKPDTDELFRSNQNMNAFRYLTQNATLSNPDALPVGFVKDAYRGTDYVGFTCAACHTAQIDYNGVAYRIDGGPAMADMDAFLHQLAMDVCDVGKSGPAQDRFVSDVIALHHYSSKKEVQQELAKSCQNLTLYNAMNTSSTAYGAGRLDAFGRIYNRVMEYILTKAELDEQVDALTDDLSKGGAMSPDTAHAVDSVGRDKITKDKNRADVIDALAKSLTVDNQSTLMKKIFIEPNAPVSYPFLWDIPQHDFVQWNGIASNAGLGPVGRNAGEVIGVFATLDWYEKEGISLSSVISGQGLRAKHISFDSSIRVHNLRLIESQLASLQSPQWPDSFPAINKEASRRGERLFTQFCEHCHARIKPDDPNRRIVAFFGSLDDVGTDRQMAVNATASTGLSGILRDQYVNAGPGSVLINEKAPAAALLTKATLSVVATPEDKNIFFRGYDWIYDLIAAEFSNEIRPSLKQGTYTPDAPNAPYNSLAAYKGRSLNGIWATGPYLHNGSVPTLYDLLLPKRMPDSTSKGEYRPDTFVVGSREFDPIHVGLRDKGYDGFIFDTSKPGNSNDGHNYPKEGLTHDQRMDLLEYLKTL